MYLLLELSEALFITNEIIADDKHHDKQRQPLLEWAISDRHRNRYLCMLTKSHSAITYNLRRQTKVIICHPKITADLKMIHDENNVLIHDELVTVRNFSKRQIMHVYTNEMSIPMDL